MVDVEYDLILTSSSEARKLAEEEIIGKQHYLRSMRLHFAGLARDCAATKQMNISSLIGIAEQPGVESASFVIAENNSSYRWCIHLISFSVVDYCLGSPSQPEPITRPPCIFQLSCRTGF